MQSWGRIIDLTIIILWIVNVLTCAKKGTVATLKPALSYFGGLVFIKPVSFMIRPLIYPIIYDLVSGIFEKQSQAHKTVTGIASSVTFIQEPVTNLLVMLIAYILCVIALTVFLYLIEFTEDLPGIKQCGKVIGGCLGGFKIILGIWIISICLIFLSDVAGSTIFESLYAVWKSSNIVSIINQYNVFSSL